MIEKATASLFDNIKYCDECHRILSKDFKGDICPACADRQLFTKVKDFIRSNDVTEYDVSEHFHIPLSRVKSWIREGRIEYKDLNLQTLPSLHCQKCGASITFGTLCAKCLRMTGVKGSSTTINLGDEGHIRHNISKKDTKI